MPKVTIKNNSPQPRGFFDSNGVHFVVPPNGGEAEVDMRQEDVNHVHWLAKQPGVAADKEKGKPAMLEVSGAGPKGEDVAEPPKVTDPNLPGAVVEEPKHRASEERGAHHARK